MPTDVTSSFVHIFNVCICGSQRGTYSDESGHTSVLAYFWTFITEHGQGVEFKVKIIVYFVLIDHQFRGIILHIDRRGLYHTL